MTDDNKLSGKNSLSDEQYIRELFSTEDCPPLPESLSPENMWKKITRGQGDGQITVPASTMDDFSAKAAEDNSVQVDFTPKAQEKKEAKSKVMTLSRKKHHFAIACSLLLVLGVSTAFWKIGPSLEKAGDMAAPMAAPQNAEPEMAAEEETDYALDEKSMPETPAEQPVEEEAPAEEAVEREEAKANPQIGEAPAEEGAVTQEAAEEAVEEESTEEEEAPAEPKDTFMTEPAAPEAVGEKSPKEQLQSRMLSSLEAAAAVQADSGEEPEEAPEQADTNELDPPMGGTEPEEKETFLESIKKQKDLQPKTYKMNSGKLVHDPVAGTVDLFDVTGNKKSSVLVGTNVKVLAGDDSFCTILEDSENNCVTMTVYHAKDPAAPAMGESVKHQGQLFDCYQAGPDAYTLVTSIWFDRQQIEAGDCLPEVNGVEIAPEKVNIIEGYGETERVNYLLTSIIKNSSRNTRADLYLEK